MGTLQQFQKNRGSLSSRLLSALENERCLDVRFRALHPETTALGWIPNYKVMKQVALRRRLGPSYGLFIALASVGILANSMVEWCVALVASMIGRPPASATGHIIATAKTNVSLIQAALANNPANRQAHYDFDLLRLSTLARRIGVGGVVRCIAAHLRFLGKILQREKRERHDLLLHSRDAFCLTMLSAYAENHPNHFFVTDCHYQRWSYMLSASTNNVALVQHGFLDLGIDFPNAPGPVAVVYTRDDSFNDHFLKYYEVGKFFNFSAVTRLTPVPSSNRAILLASSFPAIDAEIAVIERVKKLVDAPIFVKLHPSHCYDDRKRILLSMASHVCAASDYPECRIFVSYNSFMEYDYRFFGMKTFAISKFSDFDDAAEAIAADWAAIGSSS